ncbi:hypothetical protein D9M71_751150 [compost metagenome]|uniref:hypothetical protein n=1 Tax=Acinetobacter calcoaceticus TaxID=471 RepID=UPI00030BBCF4|nr:hypothetical protein [Acinetobacter calcoaceticus]KJH61621.1 hypothetical protein UF12_10690 [Acinetobacter calcoaceticus]
MPNLTFYVSKELLEQIEDVVALTQDFQSLCVEHLGAEVEKVHIIYISVQSGCGHPIYAELRYRLLASRSPEMMTAFMHKLDQIIQKALDVTSRIRCFAYPPEQLYAYN